MTNIGIVGAGGMGTVHARSWRRLPNVSLHIFDHNPERTLNLARQFEASVASSLEELIARCDAVDICLPTDLHAETALKSIAAGKAVLCEKPLARTIAEGFSIVRAVSKANVLFMAGHVVRYFPAYKQANSRFVQGDLGRAAAVRMHRGGFQPSGTDNWFLDFHRSGGVLLDVAIHDFDWLRWTFGEVEEIYADDRGNYAQATLKFVSGLVANLEATWLDPAGFGTSFEIAGSHGLLSFDNRQTASLKFVSMASRNYEANLSPDDDPYFLQIQAFFEALKAGTDSPISADDGLNALTLSLSAIESAVTGKKVRPSDFLEMAVPLG